MPKVKAQAHILPVMIGTAGHVDHGKTALVRNLTGCETDRLAEEKARGMSINLGFAACRFPGLRLAGVVDVPGHETFIRNMVAGAASMDIVLLVVAADDGIMPQTIEHMQIVKLLRTPRVLAVVTKIDLVDAELLELVKQDVADFLAHMGFAGAPVLGVSNETLDGLAAVREALDRMIADVRARAPSDRSFRMNIERAFSSKGYGTVVTGIPCAGAVHVGEEVELLPGGQKSGVRFIQSYQLEADQVEANVCGALNLRNIELAAVHRGMTVATAGSYQPTDAVVARLRNVSRDCTLKRRTEVRFHTGTAVVSAGLRLIDVDRLAPGREAFAQLVLQEPLVVAAGDRYIVRSPAPADTVGGGTVLAARGRTKLSWRSPHVADRLEQARRAAEAGDCFLSELLLGPSGILFHAELVRLTQRVPEAAARLIDAKQAAGELVPLGGGAWLVRARARETAAELKAVLRAYHEDNRHSLGMEAAQVVKVFGLETDSYSRLAEVVCAEDPDLVVRQDRLAVGAYRPILTQQQARLREKILAAVEAAGPRPPARGDLMRDIGVSEADMRVLCRVLAEERKVKVVRTNLLLYSLFDGFRAQLLGLFADRGVVDIGAFREATGVSRNMAEALLEAYDAEGITRRVANGRVRIGDPRPGAPADGGGGGG
ncbi:MAG: selenocysteine-specific translation elongation factor [Planctomycetes bacterium]|nr:selenocysteine-specific translation elongation factor [Planctomycetota bacterium]